MLAAIVGAAFALQPGVAAPPPAGPPIEQIQFRGSPEGGCPDGYDFNYSNGRCYPNSYKAPGVYARPIPEYPPMGYGYYRPHRYGYPRYAPGYYPRY
ncbi:hypothetical protein EAS54_33495 [Bradyrhizobium guangzhouense]|uniref:Uncharacterized protein n=1 Tax=Bradyrhizobium guangzhouense TaxID=1325095 RepID=A0AAE6C925_9BRAD|nr:hypothetical protein XH91_18805 [Bradyrhizobium guangzhouense]RXH09510.1 hypothetical protein EAS54_33495 [Bradyrhizobium guangzhouense]RXH13734.1 hypothetical protein EAS56_14170 [Bradyrhizobium guangzhouense]